MFFRIGPLVLKVIFVIGFTAFVGTLVATSWIGSASADDSFAGRSPQLAEPPPRENMTRPHRTSPEMREIRREWKRERFREATPSMRRQMLRRERRRLHFLPDTERRAIRLEKRALRRKHGIGTPEPSVRPRGNRKPFQQLELSPRERRALRARLQKLAPKERRELRRRIGNTRGLSETERELLRERLHEMKSLSEDGRQAFRENVSRWAEMSDERRAALRGQMRRLRALPAEERLELLERALDGSDPR